MSEEVVAEASSGDENDVRFLGYTMRTNLLNCCNLVSISKNTVFYDFGVVRIC